MTQANLPGRGPNLTPGRPITPLDLTLKVKDVAKLLQCSSDQIYALIYSGRLPATDISANPGKSRACYRVSEKALEQFLAEERPRR